MRLRPLGRALTEDEPRRERRGERDRDAGGDQPSRDASPRSDCFSTRQAVATTVLT